MGRCFFHGRARLIEYTGALGEPAPDVTQLLERWTGGEPGALDALMPVVYGELRKIADAYLRRERTGHTLQPTALVHEAWLRLVKTDDPSFAHRRQFFALAAQMMRRILVDHARGVNADKRGGGAVRTTLAAVPGVSDRTLELIALDDALEQLARVSPRQARVIDLRYFAGLGVDEMAAVLGVSAATVSRDQKTAEAWLAMNMQSGMV